MYTRTFNLDMVHGGVPLTIPVSQSDAGSCIRLNLYLDGTPFVPVADITASINITRPDGTYYSESVSILTINSIYYANLYLSKQLTNVPGKVICEIRIVKGTNNVGTANFILDVEKSPCPEDAVLSETEIPVLQEMIDTAMTAANNAMTAANRMAYSIVSISGLTDTTRWLSVFNNTAVNTVAIGYYYNANKTDSYSGDTGTNHLVVIIKPSRVEYSKIIVFVNSNTIHVGRPNAATPSSVVWDS